ncbi:MAG: hypothetical protein OXFUSZZB_001166 [Candidatus Fervidibacter sp.]|jgi:hypothetical protein
MMVTAMERANLVTVVESEREKFLLHCGEGFLWESLPVGTRVIYPPPPLEPIADLDAAIEQALENPINADPLSAQLRRGMRVTIAFDDLSLPLPPMQQPDIRQRIIERILQKCAEKGVDDIHLIAAIGLHRKMTTDELRHQLGDRILKAFYPLRLYCHDAEDPRGLTFLGKTEQGEEVWLNRRVAESDLVIYVNINLSAMDGGHKSLVTGLTNYATLRHHHNAHMLLTSFYMDPPRSPFHGVVCRQGRLIERSVRHFQVETVLNTDTFPSLFGFLQKRESAWTTWDRIWFHLVRTACRFSPFELNWRIWQSMRAPYGIIGIYAGEVESVHERTLQRLAEQQEVEVSGQSDIVICGVPYLCPYNVNSLMNPILVFCLTLGYTFHLMSIGKPLLRQGGVLIFTHPLYERFHEQHHPSYVDFWRFVLPQTRDPQEMERRFEAIFATDERYIRAYRRDYAYHGVHPFYMWYWGSLGARYAGKVIFVGANKRVAERLGVETASSLREAVEMAKSFVGNNDAAITYFHFPPIFTCRVR